jgi:hypothetical protein
MTDIFSLSPSSPQVKINCKSQKGKIGMKQERKDESKCEVEKFKGKRRRGLQGSFIGCIFNRDEEETLEALGKPVC